MTLELAPQHKRGLLLNNPIMNAAGVLGFGHEYRHLIPFDELGAFVTNPFTYAPRNAAYPPNAHAHANGLVIHTGLPNPGVRTVLKRHAREWERLGPPVIAHLAATTVPDVQRSVEVLERVSAVSGIELGFIDAIQATDLERLIRAARGALPILARLPVARAAELCERAVKAGADALTLGAPPRLTTAEPEAITGRFYSPDNFPLTLEVVQTVSAKDLGVPLIGGGGIFSGEQARQLLAVGATALQLDVWLWREPTQALAAAKLGVTTV